MQLTHTCLSCTKFVYLCLALALHFAPPTTIPCFHHLYCVTILPSICTSSHCLHFSTVELFALHFIFIIIFCLHCTYYGSHAATHLNKNSLDLLVIPHYSHPSSPIIIQIILAILTVVFMFLYLVWGTRTGTCHVFVYLFFLRNPLGVLGHIIHRWKGIHEEIAVPLES